MTSVDDEPDANGRLCISLDGGWSVLGRPLDCEGEAGYRTLALDDPNWLIAQVPGEIHLDLMRAGRMEDPNVSDNARARCRWPEQSSWWYRAQFDVPTGFRERWRQELVFDAIDLHAQVFVNGALVGTSKNAFVPARFDVKGALREGQNEVVVRVTSGLELLRPEHYPPLPYGWVRKLEPTFCDTRFQPNDQRRFLRKPAYSAHGWDFCDPLPNIGIHRSVRLEGRSRIAINHLRVDTVVRGGRMFLEGEVVIENLHPWAEIDSVLEMHLQSPSNARITQRCVISAHIGRSAVPCSIAIDDPQLWWPNGLGGQPLYRLTARVLCDAQEMDRCTQTLGLRTIELDRSALPEGSRFCLRVNGEKVFCKGGNWAPADLIPVRIDAPRYEKLVAEAKNAHFTMLRVNGVGLYESDAFYDACDRAGILVWQDFTFSCAQYPDHDQAFLASVRHEAEEAIKRLRHHASLALWCGNNECTWFMRRDWQCTPERAEEARGVKIYNELLPDVCRIYDPIRPYWPASPSGGSDDPNSETSGDTHWWAGGHLGDSLGRVTDRAVDESRSRFISEYGIIGPPALASVCEFLKPDERTLNSPAWRIHTNALDIGGVLAGIRHEYGDVETLTLSEFVLYGQMYQAKLHGRVVDAMRFRKNDPKDDCQGVLVWSFNDTWGETGWSIIDYYARRKASYYGFRRSAAPVKVLVRSRRGQLVTRVVNDTLKSMDAVVRCGWMRLDGRASELSRHPVVLPANGTVEVAQAVLSAHTERNPSEWLYAAVLEMGGVPQDHAIWLLTTHGKLALPDPKISVVERRDRLEVSSATYCHGVHFETEGLEELADNYFDLLPGISRHIPITPGSVSVRCIPHAVMPLKKSGRSTSN